MGSVLPRVVGIDPGQNGGAVEVAPDGETVLGVQRWAKCKRPPAMTLVLPGTLVVLEQQHVGGPHASLVLATWCGVLMGQLPGAVEIDLDEPDWSSVPPNGIAVIRPLATTWRAKVFRDGRLSRDAAKRLALAAATPRLHAFDPAAAISHDVAEGWCLARFGTFWLRAHPARVAA